MKLPKIFNLSCIPGYLPLQEWRYTGDITNKELIKELVCQGNAYGSICKDTFTDFPNVTTLRIKDMSLTSIPEGIEKLKDHLTTLEITNTHVYENLDILGSLRNLNELILIDNGLSKLPACIPNLPNLTKLTFSKNDIRILPYEFCRLRKLEYLNLSDINLSDLPPNFGNLSQLTKLDLSGNDLYCLTFSFCMLSNLKILNLRFNQFDHLPFQIYFLQTLEKLFLNQNSIKFFVFRKIDFEQFSDKLQMRLIQDNPTKDVGGDKSSLITQRLPRPDSLSQQFSNFTNLGLKNLKNLNVLDLSENFIEEIGSNIKGLENLEVLWLHSNEIYKISEDICELTKLKILDLHNNQIRYIPSSFTKFAAFALISINLQTNPIKSKSESKSLGMDKLKDSEFRFISFGQPTIKP